VFSKYACTNATLQDIVHAASDLDLAYIHEGYPTMNIVVAPRRITNGIVTLEAFSGAVPQVVVGGNRYPLSTNGIDFALYPPISPPPASPSTNVASTPPATNAGPRFAVNKYEILGNTLLSPQTLGEALTNVPGAFGTNVNIDAIRQVVGQLGSAYRQRGYVTVAVGLPPQKLTNATVKLQVTEGRLNEVLVKGNHYFSSNNVMRAMPGLYPGMILNGLTFQAELNRANANRDRQISSYLDPGPIPGTSDLTLQVKDRLPFHAKAEFNNESSPGTPDLRVNTSASYGNLWDHENTLGVQYSFSPVDFKGGPQWHFYDLPLVANYSAFYRIPLGSPEAIDDVVAANPDSFGYSEATRKFVLPPSAGQPGMTIFASRSAIDTGIETLSSAVLYNVPHVRTITEQDVQQDLTINNDLGVRLDAPIASTQNAHWNASGGIDFKTFETVSSKTNIFSFYEITLNSRGDENPPVITPVISPVPRTDRRVEYLPLNLGLNGDWRNGNSSLTWSLGLNGNLWHSGSERNIQAVTGSTRSSGYWIAATPSLSYRFQTLTNWEAIVRLDGQVASEPLISVEQFGIGGVNSVRGYHEGEVFGDDGWHVSFEQLTPPHTVGMVFGHVPLVIRGSVYMDYAHVYSLDAPGGASGDTALWGTGVGCVASVGSFWETRFLFSFPLLSTATTEAYQPFFNFALTAQF